jgi:transposase
MPRRRPALALSTDHRQQLQQWADAMNTPQQVALRCRIVLACAAGETEVAIARNEQISRPTVRLWRDRFAQQGPETLWLIAPGRGRKPIHGPELIQEVITKTLQTKPPGATHWSCRTLAAATKLSKSTIHNIWRSHNLKPT